MFILIISFCSFLISSDGIITLNMVVSVYGNHFSFSYTKTIKDFGNFISIKCQLMYKNTDLDIGNQCSLIYE